MRLALQLYTLREMAARDLPAALAFAAETGFEAVELAGLYGRSAGEMRRLLDECGLTVCGAHVPFLDGSEPGRIMEEAEILGCRDLVCGYQPPEAFATPDAVKALCRRVETVLPAYRERGFNLHYHNHWWEFDAPGKGDLLLDACPGLLAEFDIYWLAVAGRDPSEVIRRHADRVRLLHVKDGPCVREAPMLPLGRGKVEVLAALRTAGSAGLCWAIVELDRYDGEMTDAVRDSMRFLEEAGLARRRTA